MSESEYESIPEVQCDDDASSESDHPDLLYTGPHNLPGQFESYVGVQSPGEGAAEQNTGTIDDIDSIPASPLVSPEVQTQSEVPLRSQEQAADSGIRREPVLRADDAVLSRGDLCDYYDRFANVIRRARV